MKRIVTAVAASWSAFAFTQACPEIESEATRTYSATFSGATQDVVQARWNSLTAAIAKCEALRGQPVSLRDEIGEDFYGRLKSPEQYLEAREQRVRVQAAQRAQGKDLFVNSMVFMQLTKEDRDSLQKQYPLMEVVDKDAVGKISSYQVFNGTVAADTSGSRLGAVVGQASFIDKAIANRSYSATGQVGAGLIGAAIGAAFDRPEQRSFTINYGVQLFDGSLRVISRTSASSSANPVGQCVWTERMSEAPFHLCNDSLVEFLGRVRSLSMSGTADFASIERVKCRADGIGVISIRAEECAALKGAVVN
jgi:hypothetical protein